MTMKPRESRQTRALRRASVRARAIATRLAGVADALAKVAAAAEAANAALEKRRRPMVRDLCPETVVQPEGDRFALPVEILQRIAFEAAQAAAQAPERPSGMSTLVAVDIVARIRAELERAGFDWRRAGRELRDQSAAVLVNGEARA
jgi:hypothetical protein